jgi:hypothetical protein
MEVDSISEIQIDSEGRLLVYPENSSFPYMYREAMEVCWYGEFRALYSPKPRKWTYPQWFTQICSAAKEQGTCLEIRQNTRWKNVPDEVRQQILASSTCSDA